MISVYITSFNKQNYLSLAIESVLDQTLQPSEIIIVDDGSTDDSRSIIEGYASRYPDKLKVILNESNLGISKTRNIALEHTTGDIITYLDGDDIFYKQKLENEYNILSKNKNIQIVYSNFNYISQEGDIIGKFSNKNNQPAEGNIFKETFLRHFNTSSGNHYIYEMFYKTCAQSIGFYDEDIIIWEDWDLRIRMSKEYQYGYCPRVNSAYRKLDNGLHTSEPELHYREQIKVYRKSKHLMIDLTDQEKSIIHNSVYSRLKRLFITISNLNLNRKKYFQFIIDLLEFLLTFKMKKALSYIYREL